MLWLKQALAAAAVYIVPQCTAAGLKNMLWALGTAGLSDQDLLEEVEAQLLSQTSHLE